MLISPVMRRASRADLLQVDLMSLALRVSRPLGPAGTAIRRRITEQIMRNMFGRPSLSDPARADDRERWRQRFFTQLVPEGTPMIREVFRHPGNRPQLLGRVEAPTLILVGQEEYGGIDDAEQVRQLIPGAQLITVPGAGHIVLVEQPQAATTDITEFIRGVDTR